MTEPHEMRGRPSWVVRSRIDNPARLGLRGPTGANAPVSGAIGGATGVPGYLGTRSPPDSGKELKLANANAKIPPERRRPPRGIYLVARRVNALVGRMFDNCRF